VGTRWLVRRLLEGADLPVLERHMLWFGAFPAAEQLLLWRKEALPAVVASGALLEPVQAAAAPAAVSGDPVDLVLRADLAMHLPEALLAKVDRATMLESLEARAPFLARDLVEHAVALPARWKVRRFRTKVILREALAGVVPDEVLARRKRGFAVPVARALAGWLGDRLEERLATSALSRERWDASHVASLLAEHRSGAADHARRLYPVLALLEWHERWLSPGGPPGGG
jgi:asparagine synthase (glutamine-hydrolysing)